MSKMTTIQFLARRNRVITLLYFMYNYIGT